MMPEPSKAILDVEFLKSSFREGSADLLSKGSAEAFVEALAVEAKSHGAVHHPYLQLLSEGRVPNVMKALQDYAFQYSFYSKKFAQYIEGVFETLEDPRHRDILEENLKEEMGVPGSAIFEELPHTVLFSHFCEKIGVNQKYFHAHQPCTTALVWRDLFYQKCHSKQPGLSVGAVGLGTELVVPTIYQYFLKAVRKHTQLQPKDYFFFTLHAQCDDGHAEKFKEVTIDLAKDFSTREAIRFGVFSSLNLRKAFWDVMLSRALNMESHVQ